MPADNRVRAIRIAATGARADALAIREIKLNLLTEIAGEIGNPSKQIKAGNTAVCTGDVTFGPGTGDCSIPVVNKGVTLRFQSGGRPINYSGVLSGKGTIEFLAEGGSKREVGPPIVLAGTEPNTFEGKYLVKQGVVLLQKPAGVDAMRGTLVVGGKSKDDVVGWQASNQLADSTSVELIEAPDGGGNLNLNGFEETVASLTVSEHAKVRTDGPSGQGGILRVGKLTVNGANQPPGIYSAAEPWLVGSGLVLVGDVKGVEVASNLPNASQTVGKGNYAVLTAPATFGPATGDCDFPIVLGEFSLTLEGDGARPVKFASSISGKGGVDIRVAQSGSTREPFSLTGKSPNWYSGVTRLQGGMLKLDKPAGVTAIPGDLVVGGSEAGSGESTVVWGADEQMFDRGSITLDGSKGKCELDLAGHKESAEKILLKGQAKIKLGGGTFKLKQLLVMAHR